MEKFLKKNYKIIVFICLFFILAVSVLNAKNDSAIFDETAHIGAGYSYWNKGEMRLNPEHPPLIKDLAGFPLIFMGLNFDTSQSFWTGELPKKWDDGQWAAGKHLLYGSGNNPDKIIFWSRLPIIILSLILGLFLFKWGKELGGTLTGLLALVLYAFDPNILGHNHFVTTDIGIAAFMTFAFYYYLRFIKEPTWKNIGLAGLFLGLLQLAKFSSLLAFPVIALVTLIYPLVKKTNFQNDGKLIVKLKTLGEYVGKGALVFFVSIVIVWVVYLANTFNSTRETMAEAINFNFPPSDTQNIKNVYTNKTLHFLNSSSITRPLAEYGIGIGYVFRRVSGGNGAYFMGEVSSSAFLAYFPVVFVIKEPLASLFLMFSALLIFFSQSLKTLFDVAKNRFSGVYGIFAHFLRTSIIEVTLFLFIIIYAYVSITGNLNIGFRHLFPILPFAYLLTAKTIARFIKKQDYQMEKTFLIATLAILAYLVLGTIFAYPNYMSYFNETVSGPKNGYKYVTDSNADWGQDLKRLQKFLNMHPEINQVKTDYFGGGNPQYYLGEKFIPWSDSQRPIESGWYAISTNFLQGSIHSKDSNYDNSYRWLQNKKPLYQVGTSILIYNVTEGEVSVVNNL